VPRQCRQYVWPRTTRQLAAFISRLPASTLMPSRLSWTMPLRGGAGLGPSAAPPRWPVRGLASCGAREPCVWGGKEEVHSLWGGI
jgi:hypothetical protein